ncbi:hypothetical protein OURE66S_03142 [Oligella ureolytica]
MSFESLDAIYTHAQKELTPLARKLMRMVFILKRIYVV